MLFAATRSRNQPTHGRGLGGVGNRAFNLKDIRNGCDALGGFFGGPGGGKSGDDGSLPVLTKIRLKGTFIQVSWFVRGFVGLVGVGVVPVPPGVGVVPVAGVTT